MTPCPRCEGGRMVVERYPVHGDLELVCLSCGCCVYEPQRLERSQEAARAGWRDVSPYEFDGKRGKRLTIPVVRMRTA